MTEKEIIFKIDAVDGWKNHNIYFIGKQKFTKAILKQSGVILATMPADFLEVLFAIECDRPLPDDITPLYFSSGYDAYTRHVSASQATSEMLAHVDKCEIILHFDFLTDEPQQELKLIVGQIKREESKNYLETQSRIFFAQQ